jgi:hypothetical protein
VDDEANERMDDEANKKMMDDEANEKKDEEANNKMETGGAPVDDPWSSDWNHEAFASRAAKKGGLKKMTEETPPRKTNLQPGVSSKKKKRVAKRRGKGEKIEKIEGEKIDQGAEMGCLHGTTASTTQSKGKNIEKIEGVGKLFAPNIGKLAVSITARGSEICYYKTEENGEQVRRHLCTITCKQTPHHGDLAAALVRFALGSAVDTEGFIQIKNEKLAQLQQRAKGDTGEGEG